MGVPRPPLCRQAVVMAPWLGAPAAPDPPRRAPTLPRPDSRQPRAASPETRWGTAARRRTGCVRWPAGPPCTTRAPLRNGGRERSGIARSARSRCIRAIWNAFRSCGSPPAPGRRPMPNGSAASAAAPRRTIQARSAQPNSATISCAHPSSRAHGLGWPMSRPQPRPRGPGRQPWSAPRAATWAGGLSPGIARGGPVGTASKSSDVSSRGILGGSNKARTAAPAVLLVTAQATRVPAVVGHFASVPSACSHAPAVPDHAAGAGYLRGVRDRVLGCARTRATSARGRARRRGRRPRRICTVPPHAARVVPEQPLGRGKEFAR